MAQVTHGLRVVLSHPQIYSAFQNLMGAHSFRECFARERIRPQPGIKVLDIGCGTADILEYLSGVEYWGFDVSSAYVARALCRYGDRGHFFCQQLGHHDLENLPSFDVVLALGLIHHLDDDAALELVRLAHEALQPGGRFVTFDPCLERGQNPLARFFIRSDRGQNVRTREGYAELVKVVFPDSVIEVKHRAWIPYTHCMMECVR